MTRPACRRAALLCKRTPWRRPPCNIVFIARHRRPGGSSTVLLESRLEIGNSNRRTAVAWQLWRLCLQTNDCRARCESPERGPAQGGHAGNESAWHGQAGRSVEGGRNVASCTLLCTPTGGAKARQHLGRRTCERRCSRFGACSRRAATVRALRDDARERGLLGLSGARLIYQRSRNARPGPARRRWLGWLRFQLRRGLEDAFGRPLVSKEASSQTGRPPLSAWDLHSRVMVEGCLAWQF